MELKEILLIIAVVTILLVAKRLYKTHPLLMNYFRLIAAILMIAMIWLTGNSPIVVKVVLSIVFAFTIIQALISLKKEKDLQ